MARYLTQHTLACLTRQGAEALAQRMQAGGTARAERVLVNMLEGKMFVEFRAASREALEGWLKTEGMHFDFLVRIEWEMQGEKRMGLCFVVWRGRWEGKKEKKNAPQGGGEGVPPCRAMSSLLTTFSFR